MKYLCIIWSIWSISRHSCKRTQSLIVLISLPHCYKGTWHSSLNREELTVSDVSVHGQVVPSQKHLRRQAWPKKPAHVIGSVKQNRRENIGEASYLPERCIPWLQGHISTKQALLPSPELMQLWTHYWINSFMTSAPHDPVTYWPYLRTSLH